MRTFLFTAVALVAIAAPAGAATRNFGITGFTKIRVDGPYKVSLATGVAPFARATGSGPALDAAGLAAADASIGAEGAATIDANVTNEATVDATGPAVIRLTGRPGCTLRTGGSTVVSGCR